MLQEPLITVTEKVNHSYLSSCSDDDDSSSSPSQARGQGGGHDSTSSMSSLNMNRINMNTMDTSSMGSPQQHLIIRQISNTSADAPKISQEESGSNMSASAEDPAIKESKEDILKSSESEEEFDIKSDTNMQAKVSTNENANNIANEQKGEPENSKLKHDDENSNDNDLREKINSLEEQLRILTATIQQIQIGNGNSHPRSRSRSRDDDENGTNVYDSPTAMEQNTLTVNSMLELESPEPNRQEMLASGLAIPTPDLEYRSYTPNYEEELRNIRKSSRGMSLDHTHVNINPTTSSASAGASLSASDLNNISKGNAIASNEANKDQQQKLELEFPKRAGGGNEEKKDDVHYGPNSSQNKRQNQPNAKEKIEYEPNLHKRTRDVKKADDTAVHTNSDNSGIVPSPAQSKTKYAHGQLPPKMSPEKTSRGNLSVASPKVEVTPKGTKAGGNVTKVKHVEELFTNTNAITDFIRGLNIDSRQPDGSASEDVDATMEEFLKVPFRIESLMVFGIAVCLDSFLSVLTVTPLKFVWSCLCLIGTIVRPGKGVGLCSFHRRHLYQMLRVLVIYITYKYVLCPISLGRLYHWIRGQAMLKLYVVLAMLEVFDRLMCSFGQDALDSLYWNTTRRPYHPRMIASTIVVLLYAVTHSLILFVHAATLNVAMNSSDSALISLLIGGNFAEIKSTVFKKYNKQSLFKITTSDICERFKLILFQGLVLLLNCSQGGMNQEMVNDYVTMSLVIMGAEMGCDWIKHSFITKFNFIKSNVYLDYSLVLAGDITVISRDNMHIEPTHALVKRLGFAQIPLVCVMFRYLREVARYAEVLTHDGDSNHVLYDFAVVYTSGSKWMLSGYILSFFLVLLGIKFLLGYAIAYKARSILLGPIENYGESDPAPKRRQAV